LNVCVEQRREANKTFKKKSILIDSMNAVRLMHSWAVEKEGEFVGVLFAFCFGRLLTFISCLFCFTLTDDSELLFTDSSDLKDENPSANLSALGGEKKRSVIRRVSELWGNNLWKNQKLRSDTNPMALNHAWTTGPLLQMARLTALSTSNPTYTGFPPLVLQASDSL